MTGLWSRLCAFLLALAVLGIGGAAWAAPARSVASTCHAFLQPGEALAALEARPGRWDCSPNGWRIETGRAVIRFMVRHDAGSDAPRFFVSRASQFSNMTIDVVDSVGRTARRSYRTADLLMADGVARTFAALPRTEGAPRSVTIVIENPRYAGIVSDARLAAERPSGRAGRTDMLIAVLCGLLIAPILFDLGYFRILRQRFLLYHAITGGLMLSYSALSGGLVARFVPLPLQWYSLLTNYSFCLAVSAAALFFGSVIEEEHLARSERQVLRGMASYCLLLALFEQASPLPVAWMQPAFYVAWLPLIACFLWLMAITLRRGSRAARFQFVAWLPLIFVSLYRIAGNIGFAATAVAGYVPFYVSISLEVLITALGVADRIMLLRRERDVARIEARLMEEKADCDALTGLLNRRGVEARLADLEKQGFTCMALLDLDHFKEVNDRHGHAVGDKVLRAAALALAPDADTLAMRMGGEEFMLLLRGRDSAQRAEARRRAITARVAELVPSLDRPVTASMGLVEVSEMTGALREFNLLYAQCDRLLYEAKATGRNRTMAEAIKTFRAPRRQASAAA